MLEQLVATLGTSTFSALIGPFIVLLICGLGLPLPEDIVLIAAGILSAKENIPFLVVSFVMYLGIIFGDSIVFFIGKKLGYRALKTKFGQRVLTQNSVDRAGEYLNKWGSPLLFVARFMPGLRSPIFFTAGMLGYNFYKFIILDSIAALISAPFFVWVGVWGYRKFENDLSAIEGLLSEWQPFIITVVVTATLLAASYMIIRRRAATVKSPEHGKS